MNPSAFFHQPEARRILERAARGAAAPLAIHFHGGEDQELRVAGYGQCEACRHIQKFPEGRAGCRKARLAAGQAAARLLKPAPFICPLGFACLTAPALRDFNQGFTITLGPYCPIEGASVLERDAAAGFKTISGQEPPDDFRDSLAHIYTAPPEAMAAIMEWTLEALASIGPVEMEPEPLPETAAEAEPAKAGGRRKRRAPLPDPYQAAPIAAALAGGKPGQARALIQAALAESRGAKRTRIGVRRARTLALAAAVLEAAERAGMNTNPSWEGWGDCCGRIRQARSEEELAAAALALLAPLKRKTPKAKPRPAPPGDDYAALTQIILEHLVEGITLEKAAARLGQTPSAITHWLQRKFGMSYLEYVGRLRVSRAKELLRRTRLSVADVARRVGINDPSNFNKLFRKFEAMTPREYQQQFGKKKTKNG